MALVAAADQVSLVDVTDAYSVILTSEAYTFPGSTSAALAGNTTTQIIAYHGSGQIPASVNVAEVTKPAGVSVTSDGHATSPTLTIAVTTSVTTAGRVSIPVKLPGDITIVKEFSFAIAYKGQTGQTGQAGAPGRSITGVENYYLATTSSSGVTASTAGWTTTIQTIDATKRFLWNYEKVTYSTGDPTSTAPAVIGAWGNTGNQGAAGKGIKSIQEYYLATTASTGVTTSTAGWTTALQVTTPTNKYLWNYEVITFTDNSTATIAPRIIGTHGDKGQQGQQGNPGADALTMSITSSAGTIFKNSAISTVLTAHVYKAGVEITGSALTALGAIKWYKDGGTVAVATGQTLSITAGDVTNKATYTAQLEG